MSKPEKVFKMGAVRASVFVNSIVRDGKPVSLRKVVIEVRYKDKAGQWQGTNSLSINDLPKAITALQQAYEYLLAAPAHEEQDAPAPPTPMSGIKPVQISAPLRNALISTSASSEWRAMIIPRRFSSSLNATAQSISAGSASSLHAAPAIYLILS
jgi:hypothetical protein